MTTLNVLETGAKNEMELAIEKELGLSMLTSFKGTRRPQVDAQFKIAKSQEGGKEFKSFSAKVAKHVQENQAHYKGLRHSEVTHNYREEFSVILGEVSPEEYAFVEQMIFMKGDEMDGSEDGLLIAYSGKVSPNRKRRQQILNSCQDFAVNNLRKKWDDLKDSQKADIIRRYHGSDVNEELYNLDAEYALLVQEYNHRVLRAGELYEETFGKGKHWRLAAIAYITCLNHLHVKRDEHARKHHSLKDYHDTHMGALLTLFQAGIKECFIRTRMVQEGKLDVSTITVSHDETFSVFFNYADAEENKADGVMKGNVDTYFANLVDFEVVVKRVNGIPHLMLGEWSFPVKGQDNPLFPMDEVEWRGVLTGWKTHRIGLVVEFTSHTGIKYVPEEVSVDASFPESEAPGAFNWTKPVENVMAAVQFRKDVIPMELPLANQTIVFRQGNGFVAGFIGDQPMVKHTDGVIAPGMYTIITHGETFMVLQQQ